MISGSLFFTNQYSRDNSLNYYGTEMNDLLKNIFKFSNGPDEIFHPKIDIIGQKAFIPSLQQNQDLRKSYQSYYVIVMQT
jgi:hypothetical protein